MQPKFTLKSLRSYCLRIFATALILISFNFSSKSQILFSEGFTTVVPAGWAEQNRSNPVGSTNWFQGNTLVFSAQSGPADSYAGANFNNTDVTGTISNWLFAPTITLKNGDLFTFYTRIPTGTVFPDRLQVRMSTNGASTNVGATEFSVGDFTSLLLDINPTYSTTVYPQAWTQFTVTISGLGAPISGRLAFRYFVEDAGLFGNNSNYIGIDNAVYTALPPCAGTPAPGNTLTTVNPVCSGASFTLTTQVTPAGGLTYVWQSGPSAAGPWTNVPGGTGSSLTTSQTAATYYRCEVTCSGNTGTSTPLQVTMNPFYNCYCASNATSAADEDIFNVSIGALNNSSTCATLAPGPGSVLNMYSNYRTLPASNIAYGNMPFSVQIGTCGGNFTNSTAIWIDFNQNANFEAGERVYAGNDFGPHTINGTIVVPASALPGVTAMRVVNVETGNYNGILPCGTYTWGETEDYLVNIQPCVAGAFTAAPASTSVICGSNATFTASTVGSFLTYSWQVRVNSGAPWTTVTNTGVYSGATTNVLTLTNVPSTMSGYQYRALINGPCTAVDFSSPPATLTVTPFVPAVTPTSATICVGSIQQLGLAIPLPPVTTTSVFTNNTPLPIPDGTNTFNNPGVNSTIAVSGIPAGATVNNISVTINIPTHSFVGDMDINLVAPNNVNMNLVGSLNGGTGNNSSDGFVNTVLSSTSVTPLSGAPAPRTGTFAADRLQFYGPQFNTQTGASTNWSNLTTTLNGNWNLWIADFWAGDVGTLTSWSISINYTYTVAGASAPGVWTSSPASPNTMFTDPAALVPYIPGSSVGPIYVKPTVNTNYSVVYSTATCTSAPVVIPVSVVNPVSAVVNPPAQTSVCVGSNATITVSAAGGPLTYQWEVSTDAGLNWSNVGGATSATLTLNGVPITMNNNLYRAKITAAPCAGTSTTTSSLLRVNALPVVTISSPDLSITPGQQTTITASSTPGPLSAGSWSWTLDGVAISGASNSQLVRIDGLGTYRARVTDVNGCVNTSNNLTIGAEASERLWIYPNPNGGQFQVRYYYDGLAQEKRMVSIYDTRGQLVIEKEFPLFGVTTQYLRMNFDLSKYPAGTYVVKVNNLFSGKIVSGLVVVQ